MTCTSTCASTCASRPRGPKGSPIVGNAGGLWQSGLESLRACALQYGDLVPLRLFRKRFLFVSRPDYVAHVLATSHQKVAKGVARRSDHILLGDGISLREGDAWRRSRRLMQPAFRHDRLAAYGEEVVALTERAIEGWREGESRDVYADFSRLTMAIVGQALLGVDVAGEDADLADELTRALATRDAHARTLSMLLPGWLPTPSNLRMWLARRRLDRILQKIVERRRAARRVTADGADEPVPDDLLSLLLSSGDEDGGFETGEHARSEMLTIFVGGHETVADLLAWTWYLLALHPEIEARLVAELDEVLGGRSPSTSDLPRLRYASMIVAEVLRLYPPAPVLIREAVAELEIGGYKVARGTEIVMSPWVLQRDPRFFDEPEVFDPNRWADGLASRLPRYSYFPFGGGPRLCLGRSFATLEATLVLAVVAQRFHLDLVPGHPVVAEPIPTLHPKYGVLMETHPRWSRCYQSRWRGASQPPSTTAGLPR